MKIATTLVLLVTTLAPQINAQNIEDLGDIPILSYSFKRTELSSTSATEAYTSADIKKSKAIDIFEFLNEQTSVVAMPASGNIFTQKLDLRGFGATDGYQNIVVVVDGRRLNSIDMVPQLLSSIPINTIESIEIIKGAGSVEYGDGATAGVISIKTDGQFRNSLSGFYGSGNRKSGTALLGYSNDRLILNGTVDYYSTDGAREIDLAGNRDKKSNRNREIEIKYFLNENLELRASRSWSKIENIYANGMTPASFSRNPAGLGKLEGGKNYSRQTLSSYVTTLGSTYFINSSNQFNIWYSKERKANDNLQPWSWRNEYDIESLNIGYNFKGDKTGAAFGFSKNNHLRAGGVNHTSKNSQGIFLSSSYSYSPSTTIDAGLRYEEIEYIYRGSTRIRGKEHLRALNIGINHMLNSNQSLFANYNRSFQSPDIDRFFNFGGTFNAFIEPAIAKTMSIGFNDFRRDNKFKATIFRANLKNEIYLYKPTLTNTNIDKSHKYGLELFNKHKIDENYFISAKYSYIAAKIDRENQGGGSYNGKNLPGVSRHNISLSIGATHKDLSALLSHAYRSSTYHSEDFANSDAQRQKAFSSTNLSLNYRVNKSYELFGKVANIFDVTNGLMARDFSNNHYIYPTNFERTFYVGTKYSF